MREQRGAGDATEVAHVGEDVRRHAARAGHLVAPGVEREDAEPIRPEHRRRRGELGVVDEVDDVLLAHREGGRVRVEVGRDLVAEGRERRAEGLREVARRLLPPAEVEPPGHEAGLHGLRELALRAVEPVALLDEQPLLVVAEGGLPAAVAVNHAVGPDELGGRVPHAVHVPGDPDDPIAVLRRVALRHPVVRALAPGELEVHRHDGVLALVLDVRVPGSHVVREERSPREREPLARGVVRVLDEVDERLDHPLREILRARRIPVALALPLLPGGALDLVAGLVGVAEQALAEQGVEGLLHLLLDAALPEPLVEAPGDQLGRRLVGVLHQLEHRHGLDHPRHERALPPVAELEGPRQGHLHVGVEGAVEHVVDDVDADDSADLEASEIALAEEIAEELQEPADSVRVALGAGRAGAEPGGDVEQEADVAREHRVHLDEVHLRDLVAAVRIEREIGAVLLEQRPQVSKDELLLAEQALVDDVADVGDAEVDAERGREAILELEDGAGHAGALLQLLLPGGEQPRPPLHPLPERRHERLEREHAIVVVVHVLADLVDDHEERHPRAAPLHHLLDGLHRFVRRALALEARAAAAVDPRCLGREELGLEREEGGGEVVLGELAVLELGPGLAMDLEDLVEERRVELLQLQPELVLRDQAAGRRVAEPVLHLAHHHGVDVLVVAGLAPHVEHHRHRPDAVDERAPRVAEVGRGRRVILSEERLDERLASGQLASVEREAEELGEARLAGSVEARDPARWQRRPTGLFELAAHVRQEAHELLVDPLVGGARVGRGVAAGDDVLLDLAAELRRLLLMEVHDRRDGAGDVSLEQVADQHGSRLICRCEGGSRGRPGAPP